MKKKTKKIPINVVMLLPTNVIMLFLVVIPTVLVIWLSFVDFQPTFGMPFWQAPFVLFRNYVNTIMDRDFIAAIIRTIGLALICIGVEFVLGLLIASIMTGDVRGKKILFPLLVVPLMIPPIVVGNNFWLIFSTNGPINKLLSMILRADLRIPWLSDPRYALIPIILSEIWHWYPLTFLILFSGLANISISEVRAAEVLGASGWQIFWRIKFPKLRGIILIALVIRLMEALKVFDVVHLLTQGGPGTLTETISFFLFKNGFRYSRTSYVSAGAWIILFVSLLGFSFALRRVLMRERS